MPLRNLPEKLRILRKNHGYKQLYVGFSVGLSQSAYSRIENGNTENIPLKTLNKLADFYQITPEQLLGWDGNINFAPPRNHQMNASKS